MAEKRANCETISAEQDRELQMAEMELHKLRVLYPDEASCVKDVYKRVTGNFEAVCRKCGCKNTKEIDERSFRCLTCHKTCWYTADTPFCKFKKIRPWVLAEFLYKKGIKLNGSQLAGLMKISKSTGNCIVKKVGILSARITKENTGEKLLASPNPDILIRLRDHKRLQEHLKVEQRKVMKIRATVQDRDQDQFLEQKRDLAQSSAVTTEKRMPEEESRLFAALTDIPQHFDSLINKLGCQVPWMSATLGFFELEGLVTRLDDGTYVKGRTAEKLPLEKRNRTRKEEASVCHNAIPVPIVVSIIDSIKLAWSDISKIIVEQFRRWTGAGI